MYEECNDGESPLLGPGFTRDGALAGNKAVSGADLARRGGEMGVITRGKSN